MQKDTGTSKASPIRTAAGGLSLLMVVAMALHLSAVGNERASLRSGPGPVIRLIAQAVTRHAERRVLRQNERPTATPAHPAVETARPASSLNTAPQVAIARPRLGTWLTDLPPPSHA